MPARETAALMAALPSWGAVSEANAPWKPPMAVRAVPTMTMGSSADFDMGAPFEGVGCLRTMKHRMRHGQPHVRSFVWPT